MSALTDVFQDNDKTDLSILNGPKDTSAEKTHSSVGGHTHPTKGQGHGGKRPMTEGVHRAVC